MSTTRDIWKKVSQSIMMVMPSCMGGHAANPGTPDVQSTEMRLRRDYVVILNRADVNSLGHKTRYGSPY